MEDKLQCVIEFEELVEGNLYTISITNKWLEKYRKYYKRVHDINQAFHLYEIDGKVIRLPPMYEPPTVDEKFLNLYKELDKISKFQLKEDYFKQEMAIYKEIKSYPQKVKQWVKKNEKLGSKDYACFLIDYLDYDTDDKVYHLSVFFLEDDELEVFVDRDDFKYTIEFLEIFNELYWV